MNTIPINLTETQWENLRKLRAYLDIVEPERFNMYDYFQTKNKSRQQPINLGLTNNGLTEAYHECGSTCCLIGMGPDAGVLVGYHKYWSQYAQDVFGEDCCYGHGEYLFHPSWPSDLNAAKERLDFVLLNKGYPKEFELPVVEDNDDDNDEE